MNLNQTGKMKVANLGLGVACLGGIVLCGLWLQVTVMQFVHGREEYHSLIPFAVGLVIGLCVLWPISKVLSGWKKHIVRSAVFTLCAAPLPFGPEGTLIPIGLALVFAIVALPSILMLIVTFPHGLLLTFIGTLCGSLAWSSLRLAISGSKDIGVEEEAPPQLRHTTTPRPKSVTIAITILYGSVIAGLAVFVVSVLTSMRSQPDLVAQFGPAIFLRPGITAAIQATAWCFIISMTGRGHNWARITVVVLCLCGIGQWASCLFAPVAPPLGATLMGVASSTIQATGVVFLFLKMSSKWFRR